ncbi:hypothetical protein D0Z00_003852 [Geotrichum galactomycetum]|uniref:Uncharacterized protein n=1 Tax=Geotrichum galactomycetum TaxID=27317 RepID=A0ACB6V033_9ASCO|nr:hypothetical protein D0Z00_003852 [Geotrichum candidum]
MEVKKRTASIVSSDEPEAKKHARTFSPEPEDGRLTKSRLREFKKDAIYRALQSYKVEKQLVAKQASEAESKLTSLEKVFALQESWWNNFSDQLDILLSSSTIESNPLVSASNFLLEIHNEDEEAASTLEKSYNKKSSELKDKISKAFKLSNESLGSGSDATFQQRLSETVRDLHSLKADKDAFQSKNTRLQHKLDQLTEKYLASERKIERLKSSSIQTLFGNSVKETSEKEEFAKQESVEPMNENNENVVSKNSELDVATKEELGQLRLLLDQSEAIVAKQKIHISEQESRIHKLNENILSLSNRLTNLSDAEVIHSVPYRSLRRRNEDLLAQIDKLESYNQRYHRDKTALINERTDFQQKLRSETDTKVNELQSKLNKCESDLARIRSARDELISSLNVKRATESERNKGMDHLKELVEIGNARIKTLEAEINRLKDDSSSSKTETDPSEIDNANIEELKTLVQKLQRQNNSLVSELPGLEAAFNKAHKQANLKITDLLEREAKSTKLVAEKAKADEKYFSAMRAKDALNYEFQKAKTQLTKSTEWIQQLREAEKKHTLKISSLEAKIEDYNVKQASAEKERSALLHKLSDAERRLDSSRSLTEKLNSDIRNRDRSIRQEIENKRSIELENEKLKKQVEIKNLTTSNGSKSSLDLESQLEELRSIAICSVCTKNWKDTAIKVCGHVMCNDCATSRLTSRLRKCPLCNKQFSQSDLLAVHL